MKEGGKHSQYLRVNTFGTKTVGPLATKSGVDKKQNSETFFGK